MAGCPPAAFYGDRKCASWRGDVGVAEPFLDLGNIRIVIERIGGRRRAQRMGADLKAQQCRIPLDQLVDAVWRDGFLPTAPFTVAERPKERACVVPAMAGFAQIFVDQIAGDAVKRNIAYFLALAGHFQVRRAATLMLVVTHPELAQLVAAKAVIEQGSEYGAVPYAFERFFVGRLEQLARLMVAESQGCTPRFRRAGASRLSPDCGSRRSGRTDTDRAMIGRRAGAGSSCRSDLRRPALSGRRVRRASDQMRAGHGAELLWPLDACEEHEILDHILIGARRVAGLRIFLNHSARGGTSPGAGIRRR
jgi:hypothetical protein